MRKYFLILFFSLVVQICKGQVLISLLLGDKINSGKIEFGLEGGANFMSIKGISPSSSDTGFNLGFYFDFNTKTNWMFHTGVIVKSPMGVTGITPYSLNNPDLDTQFAGGNVQRNLRYFNVPFLAKYNFRNHFYAEGGIMLGLLYKAFDQFSNQVNGNELTYKVDILDQFHRFDAGGVVGVGYRLMKGHGMNITARYYYGFADINKSDAQPAQYNRSFYLVVGIPIGKGKAEQRRKMEQQPE